MIPNSNTFCGKIRLKKILDKQGRSVATLLILSSLTRYPSHPTSLKGSSSFSRHHFLPSLAILPPYKEVLPFFAILYTLFFPRYPSLLASPPFPSSPRHPFLAVLTSSSFLSSPRHSFLAILSSPSFPSSPRHFFLFFLA